MAKHKKPDVAAARRLLSKANVAHEKLDKLFISLTDKISEMIDVDDEKQGLMYIGYQPTDGLLLFLSNNNIPAQPIEDIITAYEKKGSPLNEQDLLNY